MRTSSKLMPEEIVIKIGEQWDVDLAGFGKMTVRLCVVRTDIIRCRN